MTDKLTEAQKARLLELAQWRHWSFPNGSSYSTQYLPEKEWPDVKIRKGYTGQYGSRYYVQFTGQEEEVFVSSKLVGKGNGVNWGPYFCTEDEVLEALLPSK